MQAQSWFNRAHVEQSKQAPGQLEIKISQEKSNFYPIPFLKVYIMIFIEKSDSKFGGLKKDLNIIFSQEKLPAEFRGDTADIGLRPVSYTHLHIRPALHRHHPGPHHRRQALSQALL